MQKKKNNEMEWAEKQLIPIKKEYKGHHFKDALLLIK